MQSIAEGTDHKLPDDLKNAILANKMAFGAWQRITPLARNEWICWTISVKQQKTRDEHVKRAAKELADGKRRPCCWVGCMHRSDKPLNPTQKWLKKKGAIK